MFLSAKHLKVFTRNISEEVNISNNFTTHLHVYSSLMSVNCLQVFQLLSSRGSVVRALC